MARQHRAQNKTKLNWTEVASHTVKDLVWSHCSPHTFQTNSPASPFNVSEAILLVGVQQLWEWLWMRVWNVLKGYSGSPKNEEFSFTDSRTASVFELNWTYLACLSLFEHAKKTYGWCVKIFRLQSSCLTRSIVKKSCRPNGVNEDRIVIFRRAVPLTWYRVKDFWGKNKSFCIFLSLSMPELTVKACAPYLDEENFQKTSKILRMMAKHELHISVWHHAFPNANNCKEY